MNELNTEQADFNKSKQIHIWNHCHNCGTAPIVGIRYHCTTCPAGPDNDLCENCYNLLIKKKIKHPVETSYSETIETKIHNFVAHEGKPAHLFEQWLSVPQSEKPEPRIPYPFVVRPIFTSHGDSFMAGYSFVVAIDNSRSLLLTALHVMDELIKKKEIDCTDKNKSYTGNELPAIITDVNIYDIFAPNWMLAPLGAAGPMLTIPDARTSDEEPNSNRDIAAFRIEDTSQLNLPQLAKKTPIPGEPVWLIARATQPDKKNIFKAVVVEKTDRSLIFKYEYPLIPPPYTSGSPILNENAEVVGILVGGGEFQGVKLGHANHVENIRKHLTEIEEL